MPYHLHQGGRRRRRRRWPALVAVLALLGAGVAAGLTLAPDRADEPVRPAAPAIEEPLAGGGPAPLAGGGTAPSPLSVRLDDPRDVVRLRFKRRPRSGLLFDLDTGRVLWRHDPTRVLPIASLTKMMTALLVARRVPPGSKVRITREALRYRGSGVGLFRRGRRVGVETMLHGLLLPSGNDAAIALAQRTSGSVQRFVALMNRRAQAMGLACTHFSSPDGYANRGTHSCTPDLAALARAVLREPRLARIVRRRQAVLPFPIKGGRIYLYNHNPLLRQGYRGVTGIKTGYTAAAGRCLVATARRGRVRLGVVLLHSPDPGGQARKLLERGFRLVGS
ncbi:MAG TPA: D-alanyl-D-alanine carboxypeptidase family protein [Solirubrobacteraceae bacterium]|nr:D-alanyl-D-alanine carboxypeptidase family protein [Solirubrobacteraceae bacterium]